MADDLSSKYGRRKSSGSGTEQSSADSYRPQSDSSASDVSRYSRRPQSSSSSSSQDLRSRIQQAASAGENRQAEENNTPESRYGRNASGRQSDTSNSNINRAGLNKNDLRKNVAEALFKYNNSVSQVQQTGAGLQDTNVVPQGETTLVKTAKAIVSTLIILVVVCIAIAIIMRPKVNEEGELLISQINKAEAAYYTAYGKYYYFAKTSYDSALGIDLSECNYFNSCEVVHNDETGNYEIKLYGAANAFTITYNTLLSYFKH